MLQPTNTTIFDKPLPSNVEVNNVSIFTANYAGHHIFLLVLEDFYHLSNFLKNNESKNSLMKKLWL